MSERVIAKDQLTAYQRWELPAVEDEHRGAEEADVGPLTAEQLEAIQQEAYQEAYKEGYEQGHKEGLAAGQEVMQAKVTQLEQLMASLSTPFEELDEAVVQEMLTLVTTVASQLIRRE